VGRSSCRINGPGGLRRARAARRDRRSSRVLPPRCLRKLRDRGELASGRPLDPLASEPLRGVSVQALDQRATVRVAELMGDVLGGQLKVVEEPRAEVTQLVEVERGPPEPAADRVPVVVLDTPRDRIEDESACGAGRRAACSVPPAAAAPLRGGRCAALRSPPGAQLAATGLSIALRLAHRLVVRSKSRGQGRGGRAAGALRAPSGRPPCRCPCPVGRLRSQASRFRFGRKAAHRGGEAMEADRSALHRRHAQQRRPHVTPPNGVLSRARPPGTTGPRGYPRRRR
jgi:hypothetical protein